MRPDIARLLTPHIYSELENHSSVMDYENIKVCFVFILSPVASQFRFPIAPYCIPLYFHAVSAWSLLLNIFRVIAKCLAP